MVNLLQHIQQYYQTMRQNKIWSFDMRWCYGGAVWDCLSNHQGSWAACLLGCQMLEPKWISHHCVIVIHLVFICGSDTWPLNTAHVGSLSLQLSLGSHLQCRHQRLRLGKGFGSFGISSLRGDVGDLFDARCDRISMDFGMLCCTDMTSTWGRYG